jgi:NADPH:quinone reductase-like Zn-dependent oxidoreductase
LVVNELRMIANRQGRAGAPSPLILGMMRALPPRMKAVVLTAYGDVDKFEVRELPTPSASRNGLVVRMAGASINPIDWKMRSGVAKEHFPVTFPGILGRDVAGEVVQVGSDVTGFKKGDRVLGLVQGAYAELVAAPAACFALVPPELDLAEAGALPLVLLTGAQLMERAVDPAPGSTVLVTGAIGSVGRVAVHAAKQRGVDVWAGVHENQREEAAHLDVTGVLTLDGTPGANERAPLFDAIADTVGGPTIQKLYDRLKPGGTIGSVLGEPAGAKERGFVVHAFMAQPDSAMLARYAKEVAEGRLLIPIAQRLPLVRAAEAQRLAEHDHPHGKVLLVS